MSDILSKEGDFKGQLEAALLVNEEMSEALKSQQGTNVALTEQNEELANALQLFRTEAMNLGLDLKKAGIMMQK